MYSGSQTKCTASVDTTASRSARDLHGVGQRALLLKLNGGRGLRTVEAHAESQALATHVQTRCSAGVDNI